MNSIWTDKLYYLEHTHHFKNGDNSDVNVTNLVITNPMKIDYLGGDSTYYWQHYGWRTKCEIENATPHNVTIRLYDFG